MAEEADGEAIEETAADGSRVPAAARRPRSAGLRPVLQRRLQPGPLVRPALPLGSRRRARHRPGAPQCLDRRLRCGEPAASPRPCSPSSSASPRRAVFFHDYHLYLAPGFVRERRAGRDARPLRPHPVAAARLLARAAGADPPRACTRGLLASDVVELPHRPVAARTSCGAARTSSGPRSDFESGERATCTAGHVARARPDLGRPERVRRARGERGRAAGRGGDRREPGPRCSLSASTAPIRRRTSCAASAPSSSISRRTPRCTGACGMLALLDPSRQDIPEYSEYLGADPAGRARSSTTASSQDGWLPLDLQIEDNFPQAVAAYKQFDVLLVNAIFDGMNLVAKEAPLVNDARRRARPLGEQRAPTRSWRPGRSR